MTSSRSRFECELLYGIDALPKGVLFSETRPRSCLPAGRLLSYQLMPAVDSVPSFLLLRFFMPSPTHILLFIFTHLKANAQKRSVYS